MYDLFDCHQEYSAPLETTRRNWKDARFKIVSLEKKNATTISDFNFPPVVAAACLTSNYA